MGTAEAAKLGANTTALLICPNKEMLAEFAPLLGHHLPQVRVVPVQVYPSVPALLEITHGQPPHLCFLDMCTELKTAQGLIAELLALDQGMQIVVLLGANDPDLILRCLRQGASEFLLRPFTAEELKPVLLRLSQISAASGYGKGGRTFCVMPAKGACGASTIASSLAYQWKRLGSRRILLADLDTATGTISFLLKLKSNYSFLDAISRAGQLDEDLWMGMVASGEGVDAMLAPENPMDSLQELPDPLPVLEFARRLYETVVLDCGGIFSDWGLPLAEFCDELLLVATNELASLQAAQRTLAHLDRHRVDRSKVRLVVNRYSRDVGLSQDAIATALHTDVYHVIPSDYESVQRALMEGKPIPPASRFGKSLATLADRLAGRQSQPRNKKSSSWSGILSSLFSKATI